MSLAERRITSFQPHEIEKNPTSPTEVWDGLIDVAGHHIASRLEDKIGHYHTNRVIIMGESGVGKTILREQLRTKILATGERKVQIVPFDTVLKKTEAQRGPRGYWNNGSWVVRWKDEDYEVLDNNIYEAMRKKRPSSLQIIELVGLGTRKRGQGAMVRAAENFQHTTIIGVVPNPELQTMTAQMRSAIVGRDKEMADKDIEPFLNDKFNVKIVNFDVKSPKKRGRMIKEAIKKMANDDNIKMISEEVATQIERLKEERRYDLDLDVTPYAVLDLLPESYRQEIQDKIWHFYQISEDVGLPLQIVFNPVHKGTIHWPGHMFLL